MHDSAGLYLLAFKRASQNTHLLHPDAFPFREFVIAPFKILFPKFSEVKTIQKIIIFERSESSMFCIISVHRNRSL